MTQLKTNVHPRSTLQTTVSPTRAHRGNVSWTAGVLLVGLVLFHTGAFCQDGTWSTKASMPTPRHVMGLAVVNGVLYALGGTDSASSTGTDTSAVEAYDPATDTWSTKKPMPTPRHAFGVGVVNGVIYTVGGYSFDCYCRVSTVEAYDPVHDAWSTKRDMPTAREGLAAAAVNGILYAAGGDSDTSYLDTVEAYDPRSDTWSTKAPMPTRRSLPAADAMDGLLYVVGGGNETGDLATIEAYDPRTNQWSTKASLPTPRWGLGAGALYGILYAAGGYPDLPVFETYDPVNNLSAVKPPMLTGRDPAVAVGNGVLYAVGGFDRVTNVALSTVETFVPRYGAAVQQPIDSDGSSVFNATRGVVPVKFRLTLNGQTTCSLPPATISLARADGGSIGPIDEAVYMGASDTGSQFRIDSCQYIYNVKSSSLGPGAYSVGISVDGVLVGSAGFALK